MKYFFDTEFHEYEVKPLFRKTIDKIELISIGIVSESNDTYYSICKDFDIKKAWENEWLRDNVLKSIFFDLHKINAHMLNIHQTSKEFNLRNLKRIISFYGKSREQIAKEVKEYVYRINNNLHPDHVFNFDEMIKKYPIEFYAYYGNYDWVVFCWLFGRMIDLPKGFPMYQKDIKQMLDDKVDYVTKYRIPNKGFDDSLSFIKSMLNYPTQDNIHNALDDALWNKKLYEFIIKLK